MFTLQFPREYHSPPRFRRSSQSNKPKKSFLTFESGCLDSLNLHVLCTMYPVALATTEFSVVNINYV